MSVLCANALSSFIRLQSLEVEGKQVVPKEKATDFFVGVLKNRGWQLAAARRRIHEAWRQAATEPRSVASASSWRDAFISVYEVTQVSRALGLDVALSSILQAQGPIDVDADDAVEVSGLVPLADVPGTDGGADASALASSASAAAASDPVVPLLELANPADASRRPRKRAAVARDPVQQQSDLVAYEAHHKELSGMEHRALVQLCLKQEGELRRQSSRIDVLMKSQKQLKKKAATAAAAKTKAITKMKAQKKPELFAIQKLGKQRAGRAGRFSLSSKFSIGLRRCLTNVAASDFGIINMVDISRQTVLRSELLTGAGIVRLMQLFVQDGLGLALESASAVSAENDDWSLFGVGYRCDATNAAIWRRKKLHVLEANVLYVSDFEKLREGNFDEATVRRHCVFLVADFKQMFCGLQFAIAEAAFVQSDLQVINNDATAFDVLALVVKQLQALGVPFGHKIANLRQWLGLFCSYGQGKLTERSVFIYCDTTDAGSDQTARRRHVAAALATVDCVLYFDCNCLLHQFHLIVRESLQLMDAMLVELRQSHPETTRDFQGYCSSLAKATNFWRSHISAFIDVWEKLHGTSAKTPHTDPDSVKYRRLPLAFVAGRWGSIEDSERFYIQRSRKLLEPVFLGVLSKYVKANPAKQAGNATPATSAGKPDKSSSAEALLDSDDREQYRIKMTKWAAGTWAAISNSLFWLLLHLGSKSREPLTHFFCWAQKYSKRRMLQRLVTGQADIFMSEYNQLLESFEDWYEMAVREANAQDLPKEVAQLVRTFALKLVVHGAGSFHRRIVSVVQRYPLRLLWLLHRAPHARCTTRKTIATELLACSPNELEANCRKVVLLCRSELEHMASEGNFQLHAHPKGSLLYSIVNTFAELLHGDTQLVESINSIVRFVSTRCPSMDLHTLSARLTCKKAVTGCMDAASEANRKRWTAVEAFARPLLQELTEAAHEYKAVLDAAHRYEQPVRQTLQDMETSLSNTNLAVAFPDLKPTVATRWAGSQASKLKKALEMEWGCLGPKGTCARSKAAAAAGFTVFCLQDSQQPEALRVFVRACSYRSVLTVAELEAHSDGKLRFRSGRMHFTSTVTLLRGCHGACFQEVDPSIYRVFRSCAVHDTDGGLACVAQTVQRTADGLSRSMGAEALEDDIAAPDGAIPDGYTFGDGEDIAESKSHADALEQELDVAATAAEACETIRQAAPSASDGTKKRKRHVPEETKQIRCDDLQLLDDAAELVRSMHTSSSSGIALTQEEIEEEALLMLIRKQNEKSAASSARGQDDELDVLVHASTARRSTASGRRKSRCFEDDEAFLQQLLPEPATESDAGSEASAADSGVVSAGLADARESRANRKAVETWEASVSSTLQSFADRDQRLARGAGHNDEVSLLVTIPKDTRPAPAVAFTESGEGEDDDCEAFEVICVKWTDPSRRLGRTVRLDAKNRVVYAPPHLFGAAVPVHEFPLGRHEDLVHASGAQSRKYKGGMRDELPPEVQRLLLLTRMICSYANEEQVF
ncbi:unnamed protein product [Symbiodinium sp. CCMP2592]|nr:unnamed protein product [Symbiodinium sp. CCMP2592]